MEERQISGGVRESEKQSRTKELAVAEVAGGGEPDEFLGEDFAGGVGFDNREDAGSWADVECCRQVVQDDMEAFGNPSDGGLGKPGDLEKAASDGGSAKGVKGGGRLGLVGTDSGASVKIGARADGNFNVVEGALSFNHAAPVKRGTGFGEGGDSARQFATISTCLEGGDSVAMQDGADDDVENYSRERQRGADSAAGALLAGADFFGDETGEQREQDACEENSE